MKIIINQDQVNSVIQQLKNNLKLRDSYMSEGTKFEENAKIFNGKSFWEIEKEIEWVDS